MLNAFHKKHPNIYAIMIGTAVVLFWRGMWGLLDLYFFPNSEVLSYFLSAVLGLALLFITHHIAKEFE